MLTTPNMSFGTVCKRFRILTYYVRGRHAVVRVHVSRQNQHSTTVYGVTPRKEDTDNRRSQQFGEV